MATFLLKKNVGNQFYWILKSDKNGETVAKSSESYVSRTGAKNSIEWVRANAKGAGLKDESI